MSHATLNKPSLAMRLIRFARKLINNPFVTWRRLFARLEIRTGFPTHFLSPTRLYIRLMEKRLLRPLPAGKGMVVGNYILHKDIPVRQDAIVYSAGVGVNIDFDLALHNLSGATIHMIDPTPRSQAFIKESGLPPAYRYFPVALFTYDGEITFYPDSHQDDLSHSHSFSILNREKTSARLTVPCLRLVSLLRQNGHDHIDVLKMDIEGVADTVLADLLEAGITPTQVVCEFEMPANPFAAISYMKRLASLFREMHGLGYATYSITQSIFGARIELLAVKHA